MNQELGTLAKVGQFSKELMGQGELREYLCRHHAIVERAS